MLTGTRIREDVEVRDPYKRLSIGSFLRPLSIRALLFARALRLEVDKGSTPIWQLAIVSHLIIFLLRMPES